MYFFCPQKLQIINRKMLRYCTVIFFFVFTQTTSAQTDSTWKQNPQFKFSGFVDVFYAYDANEPVAGKRQEFIYNHNRHNEFNINLGLLKLEVDHARYRANFAIQAGTYANDNYMAETGTLKNVFEANAGISLSKNDKLWLDAGIFGSHIGFEYATSIDNLTLTRSLLAESSPYFLSGAKLTYTPNDSWEVIALICNGWQRIEKVAGNSIPSFGTQLIYSPGEKTTLNWSTFIGTDDPDEARRMRYFNNFYGQFTVNDKIELIAGFDVGAQERLHSADYDVWYGPVIIAQYKFGEQWAMAFRAEYFDDENGVINNTMTPNGFKTSGVSLNFDYRPYQTVAIRLEGRWFNSRDQVFMDGRSFRRDNAFIVASLAIRFGE